MKKIGCWKTTDGKVFENQKEAEANQRELDLKPALEGFFDDVPLVEGSLVPPSESTVRAFIKHIMDHRDELLKILDTKKKRERKKPVPSSISNYKEIK